MEPDRVGRILGVGARVAAKTIRDRVAQAGAATATSVSPSAGHAIEQPAAGTTGGAMVSAAPVSAQGFSNARNSAVPAASEGLIRRLARGAGRFIGVLLHPFAHAGHLLWLEITGVFFGLFALFFITHGWQTVRAAGWHDRHAEVYCGLALLFVWFAVSSFWRAKRKQRTR